MIRAFVVLLLLAVFFLSGTLYGMDRGDVAANDEAVSSVETSGQQEKSSEAAIKTNDADKINNMEQISLAEANKPVHFTEKIASFLEGAVKGFYEVVVEILYQISALFF